MISSNLMRAILAAGGIMAASNQNSSAKLYSPQQFRRVLGFPPNSPQHLALIEKQQAKVLRRAARHLKCLAGQA